MTDPAAPRRALVMSYSDIASDPRVRRQVDWLTAAGWIVDTLGLGEHPTPDVRDHFALAAPTPWVLTKWGAAVSHRLVPRRRRFRLLVLNRIPEQLRDRVRSGEYDLVVFNELEFLAWVSDPRDFTRAALAGRLNVDLHEYHDPRRRRRTFGGWIMGAHYRWLRGHIAHPAFTGRTVVNAPIGRLYADEFGIAEPIPVRNVPPYVDQAPSAVDPGEIRMLFHGMASYARGLSEVLEAMRTLPDHFSMTFMLMPNPDFHAWLREQIAAHPARDRLHVVPPAPMREIAERINEYDLEIVFYRPLGRNLEFALPNKFFESMQGRLGVVVAEGATMAPLVREWGNGIVVPGFEASDLERELAALTPEDVTRMKERADVAARAVNAAVEGQAFLAAVAASPAAGAAS